MKVKKYTEPCVYGRVSGCGNQMGGRESVSIHELGLVSGHILCVDSPNPGEGWLRDWALY